MGKGRTTGNLVLNEIHNTLHFDGTWLSHLVENDELIYIRIIISSNESTLTPCSWNTDDNSQILTIFLYRLKKIEKKSSKHTLFPLGVRRFFASGIVMSLGVFTPQYTPFTITDAYGAIWIGNKSYSTVSPYLPYLSGELGDISFGMGLELSLIEGTSILGHHMISTSHDATVHFIRLWKGNWLP